MYKKILFPLLLTIPFFALNSKSAYSQYFGQNKVNYEQFDFSIYKTPHFNIYNYVDSTKIIEDFGRQTEHWYKRHFSIFRDTVKNNPLILYNNHPDFQQTTVISGLINVGTGGVTEGLRQRVVMPFMESNRETDHVLGHEMVHVFQYNLIKKSDSLGFESLQNIPLWMIEGMAEYMSIGPRDNKTAMWLRDAVIHDDVPTIEEMTKYPNRYFPYRYGHAFWAFVTGIWGDAMIKPLLSTTAKYGLENATRRLFGLDTDSLSVLWEKSIKKTYKPFLKDTIYPVGRELFTIKNSGEINLSPVISPDGNYITFLTNKNVISIDLLMARTSDKEIIKKLTSTVRKSHIDDFNYIESAGSWSPDGKKYVLSSLSKGKTKLMVVGLKGNRAKVLNEYYIEGVDAFKNPRWSPKENKIIVSGLKHGKSDLYLFDLQTEEVKQLTNDQYSDLQPSWSPDGENIVFISDRGNKTNLEKQVYGNYRLSIYDRETEEIITLNHVFPEKDVFSPKFSPRGDYIYFLSHADGFRNLYKYEIQSGNIFKLSDFVTGITGITSLAPSYSISDNGKIAYTLYINDNYHIYLADEDDFNPVQVSQGLANNEPEILPPGNRILNILESSLTRRSSYKDTAFKKKPYKPQFQLEYIGSSGMGVGTSQFGTYASGGVSALFNDVLKRHQLFTNLQVQGEIYDIGGQVAYFNRESRLNWGGSFSHIPYRYSYYYFKVDSAELDGDPNTTEYVDNFVIERIRIFHDELSVFGQYPLSRKLRFEAGTSISRYSYRIDSINNYYVGGILVGEDRQKLPSPEPFWVGRAYVAYVGDNSRMGITGPLDGYRYRFQVDRMFAEYNMYATLFDFRKYFFKKPLSFGIRALNYARYGEDAESLYPLYVGDYYFVRGYSYGSFERDQAYSEDNINTNKLAGSKMGVINAEVRLPFSGPKRLTMIKSRYFYTSLIGFFDGGFACNNYQNLKFSWEPDFDKNTPIFSTGLALRINLFGYFVLEPYVAIPFQRNDKDYTYGLFIRGIGW